MGRLIPPHIGAWKQHLLPTAAELDPYVLREKDHWFWDHDVHVFDGDRLAVYPWGRCKIVVVRALWVWSNNIDPHELLHLRRECPYNMCVNPAHVVRVGTHVDDDKTYVMTKPLRMRDGTNCLPYEVRARIHAKPEDVTHTMCGQRAAQSQRRSRGTVMPCIIECFDCVRALIAMGYEVETRG